MLRGEQAHYEVKHYQRKQMSCDWTTAEVQVHQNRSSQQVPWEEARTQTLLPAGTSSMGRRGAARGRALCRLADRLLSSCSAWTHLLLRGVFLTGVSHGWNCEGRLTLHVHMLYTCRFTIKVSKNTNYSSTE